MIIDLHAEYYLQHPQEYDEDEVWPRMDAVKQLWTGIEAMKAGVVYLDDGFNRFRLKNGASFTVGGPPMTVMIP